MIKRNLALGVMFSFSLAANLWAAEQTAPVEGFARSFVLGGEIANAKITILETGAQLTTDEHGKFNFNYPVGKPLTLEIAKWGYKTTQSETVIVPQNGLTGPYQNLTFQIPSLETYYLFATIIGAKFDPNACHVATTVLDHHKTLDDVPQGIEGAKLKLSPYVDATPFYFDIFKDGPLKGKTNPFTKNLTTSSLDGGAAFINLPVSPTPYVITAEKDGVVFSQAQFWCRADAFINISPPRGPMVQ